MSESKQRKIGVVLSYVSIVVSTFVQLIYTPLLIKMLGQSEYGLYSLTSSIIGYLTVLDLGFGNAIIVYTAKYRTQKKYNEEKKLHGMFKIIFSIIGLITAIIGFILFLNVNNIFGNTMTSIELKKIKIMMLILIFNLVVTFQFAIYSSIISAYEKFTFQKILSIINTLLKPILMIPLLFLGFKSITMCIILTIVNLIVLLSNYYYCRNKLNVKIKYYGFDKMIFKTIFCYSIYIFLGIIVEKINWSVDQFILGAMSGTIAVSLYSVASQFNTLYMNLSSCCCNVMLPKLSKMVSNNDNDKNLNNEFIRFGRLQWYIMFLILCGFIIYGKEFIKIWAGSNFVDSYYIALILIIPVSLVLVQNIGLYIMQAKNLHKTKAIITFVAAIANVIISIPLAKYYGGVGSAIGTSLSLIVCNLIIINIYYSRKVKLDVISFWKNILLITLPLIPLLISGIIINIFYKLTSLFSIIVGAIIFSVIYFIIAYLFSFNEYEKNIIYKIIIKIFKKVGKNNEIDYK